MASLPASKSEDIPWLVKVVENDHSFFALPGAISLMHHDVIHILLGRGLLNQDEGFVIGFTMGTAQKLRYWQYQLFRFIARYCYPKPYCFKEEDLIAFDLGYAEGLKSGIKNLHLKCYISSG